MAEDGKPQRKQAAKPAVKKTARKKSPAKKRATGKKAAVKKPTTVKKRAPAANARPAPVAPQPTAGIENGPTAENTGATIAAETSAPTEPHQTTHTTPPARRVWWRAAIMLAVVVLIFAYIRNSAHDGGTVTAKNVAPSPWASESPSVADPVQTHPWELAPLPEGNDFDSTQPYYTPQDRQAPPRLEPWQPPQSASQTETQPYYPPPPGYYGFPPAEDGIAPDQY